MPAEVRELDGRTFRLGEIRERGTNVLGQRQLFDLALQIVIAPALSTGFPLLTLATSRLGAHQIDAAAVRLGEQVRAQRSTRGIELLGIVPQSEEHLLDDVFRERPDAQDAEREPERRTCVTSIRLGERGLMEASDGHDELGVARASEVFGHGPFPAVRPLCSMHRRAADASLATCANDLLAYSAPVRIATTANASVTGWLRDATDRPSGQLWTRRRATPETQRCHPELLGRMRMLAEQFPGTKLRFVSGIPLLVHPGGIVFVVAGGQSWLSMRLPTHVHSAVVRSEWGNRGLTGDWIDVDPWLTDMPPHDAMSRVRGWARAAYSYASELSPRRR